MLNNLEMRKALGQLNRYTRGLLVLLAVAYLVRSGAQQRQREMGIA